MRVALVKAPRPFRLAHVENSESLALGYLGGTLRAAGHTVDIHNAALKRQSQENLEKLLLDENYGLIGFTLPDPGLFESTRSVVDRLRDHGFSGHLCAGGHTATFHSEEILASIPGLDSVILHEAENSLTELVRRLQCGIEWTFTPGVVSRHGGNRSSVAAQPRPDLSLIPFPARDDLPWVLANLPDTGAVPVLASRGCYFNCSFCSVRAFYEQDGRPTWRRRTTQNVLDEVEALIEGYGVCDILFVDDLFISRSRPDHMYACQFAEEIQRRSLDFRFTISATIDSVSRETFASLQAAGLRQVFLGAESADEMVLRQLGKWFGPREIERAVETLSALGLTSSVSFINFTPSSTLASIRQNVRFFCQLGTNVLQGLLNRLQVYGGTPVYRALQGRGRLVGDFPNLDYVCDDVSVDVVYGICEQTMGSLLNLASLIKQSERRLELRCLTDREVEAEVGRRPPPSTTWARQMLTEAVHGINSEVSQLFETVVDYVEEHNPPLTGPWDGQLVKEVQGESERISDAWSRVLLSLEIAGASSWNSEEFYKEARYGG